MADHDEDEEQPRNDEYPLDPKGYNLLDEIGKGPSSIVDKATCIPLNNCVVAIKTINLDPSGVDFNHVSREKANKMTTLLSHTSILNAHCYFTANRWLFVVMPYMYGGSLQSIIESSFPNGLSQRCIALVLKETLCGLSYIHGKDHVHGKIKPGNIFVDSNGAVKLTSIYEPLLPSPFLFGDYAGTQPYWEAPEVVKEGYTFKSDIWTFGITALELFHGRVPLSHLAPSKSLFMEITKIYRFGSDHKVNKKKRKLFSKEFKEMVELCLDQDPLKRPSADELLRHEFFNNCDGPDYMIRNVLRGLDSVEKRFMEKKERQQSSRSICNDIKNVEKRRISGWNFIAKSCLLDPVFSMERKDGNVQEKPGAGARTGAGGDQSDVSGVLNSPPGQVVVETLANGVASDSGVASGSNGVASGGDGVASGSNGVASRSNCVAPGNGVASDSGVTSRSNDVAPGSVVASDSGVASRSNGVAPGSGVSSGSNGVASRSNGTAPGGAVVSGGIVVASGSNGVASRRNGVASRSNAVAPGSGVSPGSKGVASRSNGAATGSGVVSDSGVASRSNGVASGGIGVAPGSGDASGDGIASGGSAIASGSNGVAYGGIGVASGDGVASGGIGVASRGSGVNDNNKNVLMEWIMNMNKSVEDGEKKLLLVQSSVGGGEEILEMTKEEQELMKEIEHSRIQIENVKRKNLALENELKILLKLQLSSSND